MSGGSGSTTVSGFSAAAGNLPAAEPVHGPIDEHCRRAPAEPLRRYIAWYAGYRQRGVAPVRHRGLPSPFLTLIFTLDEPLVMLAHPDPGQPPGEFGTLLGGLHSTPALMIHGGAQSGIQLAVRPLGARALLGLPAGELADIDVPAEAVLGGSVCAELRTRVAAATCWRERFAVLDDILLRLIRAGGASGDGAGIGPVAASPAAEVAWAWRQLLVSGGTARVSELAAGTGWSSRHLASRFRTEIGLTPKAAARVIRFHRTRRLLVSQFAAEPEIRLADLAATCGYFDQAHLAREFRALAGCPPSQLLAEFPAGGVPSGGVPSGGVPSGGVPSGGVPSGGVPTGGVPKRPSRRRAA